jgi:alpha-beta hydrolase superfamily lysophospholipase
VPEQKSALDSLPFDRHWIKLPDRTLNAHFLSAGINAPAFFLCTGNSEALYEWMPMQKYLRDKGYSSYIFSFSGFGNSSGTTTLNSLYEDTAAAWEEFIARTPSAPNRYALSHSLGGSALLGSAKMMDPAPDKLIIHAPFSDIRTVLVERNMSSPLTVWLWPDALNNVKAVKSLDIPILFMHSKNDQIVSYTHSETLLEAAGETGQLYLVDDYGHNAIYQEVGAAYFSPIMNYINEKQ